MSRSELLVLGGVASSFSDRTHHGFTLVPDDQDGRALADVGCQFEHVVENRTSRRPVKDFDGGGLHPGSQTRGEDDHIKIGTHGCVGCSCQSA